MTIATASTLGQKICQVRLPRSLLALAGPSSRTSIPMTRLAAASFAPACCGTVSVGMTGDLRTEPIGDLGGLAGDVRGVDAPRPRMGDRELLDHPARSAAQQDHPVAEPD